MEIRSITALTNLALQEPELAMAQAANFLHNAEAAFKAAGFTVQTRRLATQPFPAILAPEGPELAVPLAMRVQELAQNYGIDYVALGPVGAADDSAYLDAIPEMIDSTDTVFCSVSIADHTHGIKPERVLQTAEVVQRVSTLTDDGLSNLFLSATANCPPGAPFFPVAYHQTDAPPSFALALQAADLALLAFSEADTVREAQTRLTRSVMQAAHHLTVVAESLAQEFDIEFSGLDFSLAPFPDDAISLGGAMERLGMTLGGSGGAAAAAVIMSALDDARFKRAGFNGLMLPVLEDSVLARRASEGKLSVTDLLLYSTICGTGLDTVPLPGGASKAALAGVLLDVAALSLRLDKPLTARLMPLPGKRAGDDSGLESFPYFAPGKVMSVPDAPDADGLLLGEGVFSIVPRRAG